MNIFVSYTLRDGLLDINTLRSLEADLMCTGNPYIDVLHNRSTRPQEHVMEMLSQASILLAFVTPAFFSSPWVRVELVTAIRRRMPIVFVRPVKNKCRLHKYVHNTTGRKQGPITFWSAHERTRYTCSFNGFGVIAKDLSLNCR
jgi:hypothetical protein